MSVRVMSWVFEHSKAAGNDRLVLLAIADRCGDDGEGCWLSTKHLAEKAFVSKRTAQRCIDNLIARGEVAVEERPGTTNMLTVLMGRQSDAPAADGKDEADQGGVKLTPVTPMTPRQSDTGDSSVHGGASPVSPDTSFSRSSSPQPPASGGRKLDHCDKHTRHRKSCDRCERAMTAAKAKPPWCGECDERTRQLELGTQVRRCPACHPLRSVS